jgi:hypothetical protein
MNIKIMSGKLLKASLYTVPVLLMAGLWGCEPTPDELKLFDEFVVSTSYDKSADFNSYSTYTLRADTIGFISNLTSDDTIEVGSDYARPVITQVNNNLVNLGYQKVEKTEEPDLAVNIYVLKNLNVFQDVNYYPGYYDPGYYNYYGSYYGYGGYYGYPYVSTYAYNTGVLVVEIIDLKSVNQNSQVKVVWNAYMGDVFSSLDLKQQSLDAVDQAFVQSPYLLKQ